MKRKSVLLSFLKLNCFFLQLNLERAYLVLTNNEVFSVFLRAMPRGRTAKASAVLEGALMDNLAVGFHDLESRLLRTIS